MIMRRLLAALALMLITAAGADAQRVPQGLNYQGIVRDDAGGVVANQTVTLRITIINKGSSTPSYVETHQTTTNAFGLFTVQIGKGTPVSGLFSVIPWRLEAKELKVEVDLGSGFVDLGSSEFMSVPYAMVADSLAQPLRFALSGLTDVRAGGQATGSVLKWNGTFWVPDTDIAGFELPFADTATSTALTPLLSLRQLGDGEVLRLEGGNGLSTTSLLTLDHQGQGNGVTAIAHGKKGSPGHFRIDNPDNGSAAVYGFTNGVGSAGYFEISNRTSDSAAVRGVTNGTGAGLQGESFGDGRAYGVYGVATGGCVSDPSGLRSICPIGVYGQATYGPGVYGYGTDAAPGVQAFSRNGHAFVALGPTAVPGFPEMRFHVANTGKTYARGSFFTPESFASSRNGMATLATPGDTGIAPGDILVVSGGGTIVESTDTNMTTVIGVSIENPAFIAGQLLDDDGNSAVTNEIGVAATGFVTINVSDENGAIAPGDLIVSSSTRGHGMKAPADAVQGSIVAKALQAFTGPGTGSIRAVVMLR